MTAKEAVAGRPAVRVRGLTVSYDEKPAVFSLDATIPDASMAAIVGPNGAGKSTLLKAILGIVSPLCGSIEIYGRPLEEVRERVAYVPQRNSVDWDFPASAIDVVMMGLYRELGLLRPAGADQIHRAEECLASVGMADFAGRQIGQLSGGQQQRVFLARALAQNADLYLLDEPFAGVDAASEREIACVMRSLRENNKTVVAIQHDLSMVAEHFSYALVLNVSKVAEGTVEEAFTGSNLQAAYGGRLTLIQASQVGVGAA